MNNLVELNEHVFVTKLAGFEHTEYIQKNETRSKQKKDDIPLVQGKNIRQGRFVEQYDWYISKNISDSLKRSKLDKRCILIPYVGSNLGEVGIFEHHYDCHMASNIAKVELTDDYFDLDYVKYYLQSKIGQSYLFQSKQGSAQPNITMESIRNTKVIFKPKKEQSKIAKVLKAFDEKIENNIKINDEIESFANMLFNYWFRQFEFKTENGGYKTSKGKFVYNKELKMDIPEKFQVKEFKDLLKENKKSQIQVGEARKNNGSIPFFTSGEEVISYNSKMVSNRNLFLNTGGNADVKLYIGDASYSTDTWSLTSDSYVDFMYIYLKSIKEILNNSFFMGSGLKHLQKDQLKKLKVLVPDNDTLQSFNDIVQPLFNILSYNYNENRKLITLKNELINMIMIGQVKIEE